MSNALIKPKKSNSALMESGLGSSTRYFAIIVNIVSGAPVDTIKIFAAFAMTCDHYNCIVLEHRIRAFWDLGRVAFPLFSFVVACNLLNGAKPLRYLQKLLLFGVASQPIYAAAFISNQAGPLVTLAIGAAVAANLQRQTPPLQHLVFALGTAAIFCPWIPARAGIEGGIAGALFPAVILLLLQGQRSHAVWFVMLLIGLNTYSEMGIIDILLTALLTGTGSIAIIVAALAARNRCRFFPRYGFYVFYPAHLLILTMIRAFA